MQYNEDTMQKNTPRLKYVDKKKFISSATRKRKMLKEFNQK